MERATKSRDISLWLLCFIGFVAALGGGMLSPIIPLYVQTKFNVSIASIASVLSASSTAWIIIQPFTGRLADKHGRKLFVCGGWLICAITVPLYLMVNEFTLFLLLSFLWGLGVAFAGMPMRALVVSIREEKTGRALGAYGTLTTIGGILGPVMGGFLTFSFSLMASFYASSIALIIACILLFLIIKEPMRTTKLRQEVMKETSIWKSFRIFLKNRVVIFLCLVGLVDQILFAFLLALIPIYASQLGATEAEIGFLLPMYFVVYTLMQTPVGEFSDRYGRRPFIFLSLLGSSLSFLVAGLATNVYQLIVLMGVLGLTLGSVYLISTIIVADLIPKSERAALFGLFDSIVDVGFIIGPIALGLAADILGFRGGFFIGFILLIVTLGIATAFRIPETKSLNDER